MPPSRMINPNEPGNIACWYVQYTKDPAKKGLTSDREIKNKAIAKNWKLECWALAEKDLREEMMRLDGGYELSREGRTSKGCKRTQLCWQYGTILTVS